MGDTSDLNCIGIICKALQESPALLSNILFKMPEYVQRFQSYPDASMAYDEKSIFAFQQTASNTACGWGGGIAGQAFTELWLICIEYRHFNVAVVYIGRAAYVCACDDNFYESIMQRTMPLWDECSTHHLKILWKASR